MTEEGLCVVVYDCIIILYLFCFVFLFGLGPIFLIWVALSIRGPPLSMMV